jgi:glyoxylase-like metal-dependent hydrolase (beta-lactamase superfamily II)
MRRARAAAAALRSLALAITLALGAFSCSSGKPEKVGTAPVADGAGAADVYRFKLSLSNAYLIKSSHPVLIDTGAPKDMEALRTGLESVGVKLSDLSLVVLTHGHADHAGLAAELRATTGAKVALGRADAAMASAGRNDTLKPTSLVAKLLRPFIDVPYTPFEPDIYVSEDFDLTPFGVKGRVTYLPGHTAGSTVIFLQDRSAFVGDMILGGSLGGAIFPGSPGEHYYHAERETNLKNIAAVVGLGVEKFYLGHGGPVNRQDVIRAFGL